MITSKTSKYIDSYLGILILSLLNGSIIVYDPVFFFKELKDINCLIWQKEHVFFIGEFCSGIFTYDKHTF